MGKIVAVHIPKSRAGKTTIAAHLAFLAAERGARTLLVDLEVQGNAPGTATQRGLHPSLIRSASELFGDVGFEKAIFHAAENLVTPDGSPRVNFSAQARKQIAKFLDTKSPP
jgi:Mrp family chromosome partitioning ATPase